MVPAPQLGHTAMPLRAGPAPAPHHAQRGVVMVEATEVRVPARIVHDVPVAVLRAGMVLVAAVACAWFALGVRQAHDTDAATALVDGAKLSASQARKADSLLKSAAALNPDREIDLLRAQVALRRAQRSGR